MRAKSLITGAFLALPLLLSGCSSPGPDPVLLALPSTITRADLESSALTETIPVPGGQLTNAQGELVLVKDSSRVVAVAGGSAEILAALGLGALLVGRDLASQSDALQNVPVVTDVHAISIEKVLSVRPTLVLIDRQTAIATTVSQILSAGIQVIELPEVWTVEGVRQRIENLGQGFGVADSASALLEKMNSTIKYPATNVRVAFLYLRGDSAIYLLGGLGSGADSILESAGLIDAGAAQRLGAFTPLTPESLIALDPDVLLVMTKGLDSVGGLEGLIQLPGVAQTSAAKNKRVVAVEDGLLLSFGPETFSLIDALRTKVLELVS
jgi:iron complex transport system substrate-binding protein